MNLYLAIKKVILLSFIVIACEIDNPVIPINCYIITIEINSSTGDILNNTINHDFVYTKESVEKWMSNEGIVIKQDSLRHITTMYVTKCIELDRKEL